MADTGFRGIDVRQEGNQIVFRVSLKDISGNVLTTGTTTLSLYEFQSDGTLQTMDWNDDTFKATAVATITINLTHRKGNNSTLDTGIWTYAYATLTGFAIGGIYLAVVKNSSASPPQQEREFQYGADEGSQVYFADIQFTKDATNTQDEYTITWFRDGARVTTGVTSPTIQLVKRSDGSDLLASTAMTQVGTTGTYKYDATGANRQTAGEAILTIVSATIDGATHTWSKVLGRDS